jgi:hypothetical protein
MNIQFLFRRVGIMSVAVSLAALWLLFFAITRIPDSQVADYCYIALTSTCLVMLPILLATIGAFRILRGETTFKTVLKYLGVGMGVIALCTLWLSIGLVLVPLAFIALPYGIGGYIGHCIQRHKESLV